MINVEDVIDYNIEIIEDEKEANSDELEEARFDIPEFSDATLVIDNHDHVLEHFKKDQNNLDAED